MDLDSLSQKLKTKNFPSLFASSIWYVTYPCYYQNYILSQMIATQIHEAMESKFGDDYILNPNIANWLIKNFYEQGEEISWEEKLREATGKNLETGAFLRKLKAIK